MNPAAKVSLVLGLFSLSFMLNVPLGYMRSKARRLSLKWFVYIHAAIPVIYLGRTFSHLDITYIPLFIAAALMGQLWGGKLEF
ncbi:MAG: hypothetical protein PVG55_03840 [Nitrospirota bacterium]|jgi:hypothetical protein